MSRPLDSIASIKVKLGGLVAAAVVVATVLAIAGSRAGVPTLLVLPVSVGLALGVTQLLAAGMVSPLRQMTVIAARMARGDYTGRVHTSATDEVGSLAVAFNRMAEDLATVDRERRDLIATISHELRTPLTAMTATLENLADGVVRPTPESMAGALTQSERLRDLVADLLELSRLEAGVARLELRSTALAPLVAECVETVRAGGRITSYDVSVPADLDVMADPSRLRQLLVNVLDNAGRHSPVGQGVHVTAGQEGATWWLLVSDSGPGVDPVDRERVFERFGADPAGGGTGLGLAVARWVAQLHGGTLRFVDPPQGQPGARLRLEVPARPPAHPTAEEPSVTNGSRPATAPSTTTPLAQEARPGMDSLFGAFWPERPGLAALRVVVACALVGLLAGATMTFTAPGLSWTLVLLGAGLAAYLTARHRRNAFTIACTALAVLLVLPVMLLDNEGIAVLGVLVAGGVFLIGATDARTAAGFLLSGIAWPSSSLRGLPWFGRALRVVGTGGRTPAVVRTVVVSLIALAVFGALFASADALFATWVDALVPNLTFNDLVTRVFVGCLVFALTLAAAYVALNPPRVESDRRPVEALGNRFEWLVPVLLVDAVFVLFLVAQAAAVFGGHSYVESTTGLTYAEYVHQGFGQLTVATVLTLFVVWAASRKVKQAPVDRAWMRVSLGLLCVSTLVVVGSALHRMSVYQEAYGFTTLRLLVDVFEGWLGVVVLLVMIVGGLGHGRFLPRIALVTGAVAFLALAAINPDAWVAGRNIDRFESTGKLDIRYLQSLSADAAPVIAERLPADAAGCALRLLPGNQLSGDDDLLGWNLGRSRAEDVIPTLDPTYADRSAPDDPCGPVVDAYAQGNER